MKHFNFMLILLSLIISGSIFAEDKTPVKMVEVTASELVARSGAGKEYRILGKFKRETTLPVFSESGEWYETKCPPELNVFIFQKYITVEGNVGVITGENVNGRADASEDAVILFKFASKTQVDVLGLKAGWVQIAPPPQATSWIAKQFTKEVSSSEIVIDDNGKKPTKKPESEIVSDVEVNETKVKTTTKVAPTKNKGTGAVSPEVQNILDDREKKLQAIKEANAEIQENIIKDNPEDKFLKTGWVRRLGRVIGRKATHALYLSEGSDICHLISGDDAIKLEDYANKFVGIKGEDSGKEKRSDVPLFTVTKIEILENGPSKIRLSNQNVESEQPKKEVEKETSEEK